MKKAGKPASKRFISYRLELCVGSGDDLFGGITHSLGWDDADAGITQHAAALVNVGTLEPGNDRDRYAQIFRCCDDTVGDHIAADDTAEDIDQHSLDVIVG